MGKTPEIANIQCITWMMMITGRMLPKNKSSCALHFINGNPSMTPYKSKWRAPSQLSMLQRSTIYLLLLFFFLNSQRHYVFIWKQTWMKLEGVWPWWFDPWIDPALAASPTFVGRPLASRFHGQATKRSLHQGIIKNGIEIRMSKLHNWMFKCHLFQH